MELLPKLLFLSSPPSILSRDFSNVLTPMSAFGKARSAQQQIPLITYPLIQFFRSGAATHHCGIDVRVRVRSATTTSTTSATTTTTSQVCLCQVAIRRHHAEAVGRGRTTMGF